MGIYQKPMTRIRCHNCGEAGHKSTYCQEDPLPEEERNRLLAEDPHYNQQNMTVLCFKCSHYGHYANVCPMKGKIQKDEDVQMLLEHEQQQWEPPKSVLPQPLEIEQSLTQLSTLMEGSKGDKPAARPVHTLTGCRIEDLPISFEQIFLSLQAYVVTTNR